ncbi:hypothetical protein [Flavobacterium sp. UBA6135]|nr:hypothetical protein [Flavobacterium sp. UBA6135]
MRPIATLFEKSSAKNEVSTDWGNKKSVELNLNVSEVLVYPTHE